jgi:hypothetical protein
MVSSRDLESIRVYSTLLLQQQPAWLTVLTTAGAVPQQLQQLCIILAAPTVS